VRRKTLLPYARQTVDDEDIAAVVRVLKSDFLTTGPEVPAFEAAFAGYVGAPHAIACSSGTAALHLACLALGLQPGDQVIVPTISFVATANCARYCGADVIFCDVDPDSGLATAETVREAIARADRSKLKAVFVVHLTGAAVDMARISSVTKDAGVALIEDACHSLGTRYDIEPGRQGVVGDCALSDFAVFSFHPVKTITTGEGGMITTRDPEAAERLSRARSHGLIRSPEDWVGKAMAFDPVDGEPNPWFYEQQDIGFNYRLSDIQAALGRSQLRKLPEFADRRRQLAAHYRTQAASSGGDVRLVSSAQDPQAVLHLMVALIDFETVGLTRREVMLRLKDRGIGSQVHYIPIHCQPYYREMSATPDLPGASRYYARCLSLPFYPDMTADDVSLVCSALSEILC
jgi:UDP-4-amino-4,6-dideoxy-N-acetyl-beta-L-altrosamine transaminase